MKLALQGEIHSVHPPCHCEAVFRCPPTEKCNLSERLLTDQWEAAVATSGLVTLLSWLPSGQV